MKTILFASALLIFCCLMLELGFYFIRYFILYT